MAGGGDCGDCGYLLFHRVDKGEKLATRKPSGGATMSFLSGSAKPKVSLLVADMNISASPGLEVDSLVPQSYGLRASSR